MLWYLRILWKLQIIQTTYSECYTVLFREWKSVHVNTNTIFKIFSICHWLTLQMQNLQIHRADYPLTYTWTLPPFPLTIITHSSVLSCIQQCSGVGYLVNKSAFVGSLQGLVLKGGVWIKCWGGKLVTYVILGENIEGNTAGEANLVSQSRGAERMILL
jgi:hypothetical protein